MTTSLSLVSMDALGNYDFRLIHPKSVPGGVCHTISMYQKGVYLGEAYYSSAMPVQ